MRNPTLYRVGGNALVAGSLLLVVTMFLHPASGDGGYDTLSSLGMGRLQVIHLLMFVGVFLLFGGWLAVLRHFLAGENEGLATLAFAGGILAMCGMGLSKGLESIGPWLVAGDLDAVPESAYVAMGVVEAVFYLTGLIMAWVSAALVSVAMLRDSAWPRLLATTGLVVSVASIAVPPIINQAMVSMFIMLAGMVWLAVVGAMFARMRQPAPVEQAMEEAAV